MRNTRYVFTGLWPFIERAARQLNCPLGSYGRTRTLWHCNQIQDALGQLPKAEHQAQITALDHLYNVRNSLACALHGIDAAILEVTSECELPLPPWEGDHTMASEVSESWQNNQSTAKIGFKELS